ncbi:MAG: hypothetical protein ACRESK_08690 [Gammaproteobacteria bacterium]
MSKLNFFKQTLILVLLVITNNVVAGQTSKHTGTVYATPVKNLMPLGNGDGVLLMQSSGIVAMSGDPPTIHAITCAGMGLEKPDESITSEFFCTLKENDKDSFDIKGKSTDQKDGEMDTGEFEVIGGSGKWAGATGKGTFIRVIQSEEGNKNIFEVEITVP